MASQVRVRVGVSNVGVFISDCADSAACCIMPHYPFIIDSFLLEKCYFLQKAFLETLIHPCFCEDLAERRQEPARSPIYFIGLCLGGWTTNGI